MAQSLHRRLDRLIELATMQQAGPLDIAVLVRTAYEPADPLAMQISPHSGRDWSPGAQTGPWGDDRLEALPGCPPAPPPPVGPPVASLRARCEMLLGDLDD